MAWKRLRTTALDNIASFPPLLLDHKRWIVWQAQQREGKITKVPYQVDGRSRADTTRPETWSTFEQARQCYEKRTSMAGLGYVLGDGIFGIDLDHCLLAGALSPLARNCIDRFESYAESSPSDTGAHILGQGDLPGPGRKRNGVECYGSRRYFTVTMQPLTTYTLRDCQEVLTPWYRETFGVVPGPRTPGAQPTDDAWQSIRVVFDANAHPPTEQLITLLARAKVKQTWECTRRDLHDQSLSGHQLAMACFAVLHGWTDQHICDLLIAHRRSHTTDLKRLDYYQRTIWNARTFLERQESQAILQQPGTAETVTPDELRSHLAQVFGCTIVRLTQEGKDNAIYSVQLNGTLIPLGPARTFRDQGCWQDLLVSHGYRPFDKLKEPSWNNVIAAMLALIEYQDNPQTSWAMWLKEALAHYREHEARPFAYHSLVHNLPFVDEGEILGVHLEHFRQWAQLRYPDASQLTRALYMTLLRQLGFSAKRVTAREDDRMVCRNYWLGNVALVEDITLD